MPRSRISRATHSRRYRPRLNVSVYRLVHVLPTRCHFLCGLKDPRPQVSTTKGKPQRLSLDFADWYFADAYSGFV